MYVTRTYAAEEAAELMGAPSVRWLIEQLRAGRFQGYKVGRHWRMTEDDVLAAVEACRPPRTRRLAEASMSAGLTRTSRRRVADVHQAVRRSYGANRR